jgi:drug/metabolite transporter (DMT)-like permease
VIGVAQGVLATCAWALGSVLTKHSLGAFPPGRLLLVELGASNVFLWTCAVATRATLPPAGRLMRLALPGVLQPGLAYGLSFVGLQWTTVSSETLIWSAESIVMLPFAAIYLNSRFSARFVALASAGFGGVVLTTFSPASGAQWATSTLLGNGLIWVAVISACLYTVYAERQLAETDTLPLLALHQLTGLVVALVFTELSPVVAGRVARAPAADIDAAVIAGLTLFAIPFWLYLNAIRHLGSGRAAQLLTLVPVFTIVLARYFLAERLTASQAVGALMVVAALLGMGCLQIRDQP